jgi:hypothetical protein
VYAVLLISGEGRETKRSCAKTYELSERRQKIEQKYFVNIIILGAGIAQSV